MNLQLIKSGNNRYKIISTATCKHPALVHLAELVKEANKCSEIKLGIYNIPSAEFQNTKNVYSFIRRKSIKLNKQKYYKFIKGKLQLADKPVPVKKKWKANGDTDINELLEGVL